jgi:hypothetical protein
LKCRIRSVVLLLGIAHEVTQRWLLKTRLTPGFGFSA